MIKVAIVVSHPIQHFCPMYASWAANCEIDLKVFFGSNLGAVKYVDSNFLKEIKWNNLYLEDFNHEFLNSDNSNELNSELDSSILDIRLTEFLPDLIIVYGYFYKLSRHAKNWAVKNKVKIAYISDAENRQRRSIIREFVKFPFLYFYFKKINYFLTVGNANEEYYNHYGVKSSKFIRMHFSIDIKNYESAFKNKIKLREDVRLLYGVNENEIVITVVGKLVDWKCQDHLILLLHQLEINFKNKIFHLFIIGSGPMENKWKEMSLKLKCNKVYFLGFVNPIDLPKFYAATDIYIHPSLIEPHSLSISEAIYMGCPIIASDTCGSWGKSDDIQIGENGYIFQHGNISELQNLVIKLIVENKIESFGQHSIKISREFQQMSHRRIIDKLKELNN